MPNAFVTGITGQDGAYLSQLLVEKGYMVWGGARPEGAMESPNLAALGIERAVRLIPVDYRDQESIEAALRSSRPDEIYNLAALSSVPGSFRDPVVTGDLTGLFVVRLLEAMRREKPDARFFQASSSELYGEPVESPQRETTPFRPQSPYGAAKAYAHWMTVNYRVAYGCHASCGILFNHESPLRPEHYVSRKVTLAAARIRAGLQSTLSLGNLEIERDWGYAGDYVKAMWLMLQQKEPDDYIVATGRCCKLRDFVAAVFGAVGLNYQDYVRVDPAFVRPIDASRVCGCAGKAKARLGWQAETSLERLVQLMVEADLKRVSDMRANSMDGVNS